MKRNPTTEDGSAPKATQPMTPNTSHMQSAITTGPESLADTTAVRERQTESALVPPPPAAKSDESLLRNARHSTSAEYWEALYALDCCRFDGPFIKVDLRDLLGETYDPHESHSE